MIAVAAIFVAFGLAGQQAPPRAAASGTVLITGSNRGLGLEFTKQYAARGWKVIATARNPETATELKAIAATQRTITIDKLDVEDVPAIKALAAKYKGTPIDVLINNAGALGQAKIPDAIGGLMKVIDGLTMANSGGPPVYFDGTPLPW